MKTAEVIQYLAQKIYLSPGGKQRAQMNAEEIVIYLIDKGVLVTSDAQPSDNDTPAGAGDSVEAYRG